MFDIHSAPRQFVLSRGDVHHLQMTRRSGYGKSAGPVCRKVGARVWSRPTRVSAYIALGRHVAMLSDQRHRILLSQALTCIALSQLPYFTWLGSLTNLARYPVRSDNYTSA
jgi:hypothetical protein